MIHNLDAQIVQSLVGLLSLCGSAAIAYVSPRLKKLIGAHTDAKTAAVASQVIDGITSITDAVVQDFNQRVVNDAKAHGLFTPELAQSVKKDAVAAVMAQSAPLLQLGESVIGDSQAFVTSLVEQTVAKYKDNSPQPSTEKVSSQAIEPPTT